MSLVVLRALQVEAALASAERQIERLRLRERAQARALMEARHQLHEASEASSAISDDCALTPEAGAHSPLETLLSPRLSLTVPWLPVQRRTLAGSESRDQDQR